MPQVLLGHQIDGTDTGVWGMSMGPSSIAMNNQDGRGETAQFQAQSTLTSFWNRSGIEATGAQDKWK